MNNKNNIILVGMPGSGKSYTGELLNEKLEDYDFVDTDALVEEKLNMSIVKIFEQHGEKVFREEETKVIKETLKDTSKKIIAIGGGAFNPQNIDMLKNSGVVFYLEASINLLYERIKNESTRPLLMNTDNVKEKLSKLLNTREEYYKKADCTIHQEDFETDEMVDFIIQKFKILKDSINILSYPVYVSSDINLKEKIPENIKGKAFIVIDERVEKLYGKEFQFAPKFVLKEGESQKNIKNYEKIINFATENNIERGDTLVAVGGGVVGDISGFAASTYLRGINLIHVPTTLLACVDSSIGGKTAINSDYGKNLIGSFYQPNAVFCDLKFLKTLDDKQFKTGLAEVLKYAFIEGTCGASKNFNLLDILEHSAERVLNRDFEIIEEIVKICVSLKESVVLKDERESGLRQILNFGHTYGHAIEKLSNYKLTHGEAIAQGMVFAFNLAYKRRAISSEYYNRATDLMKKYKIYKEPAPVSQKITDIMIHDKKMNSGKINFVLPYYPMAVQIAKLDLKELQN